MEKQDNRVLAYSKAKIINHQELSAVSGGKFGLCNKASHGPTGGASKHVDTYMDIVVD